MPYKDKTKQQEAIKRAVQKHRVLHQGITSEGITDPNPIENVIPKSYFKDGIEYVPPLMVEGCEGRMYEALPERPRFLTLSGNQVLDRTYKPDVVLNGEMIHAIKLLNEARFNYRTNRIT